jgi:CheY-like chemotaxis protein
MSRRVLSVGQCSLDHGNLSRTLRSRFAAEVVPAASAQEALAAVAQGGFSLVLVNRVFDADGDSGLELIARLEGEAPEVPVMLVSNFADAQELAVESGAVPGFGKAALSAPETLARLEAYLGADDGSPL